MGFTSIEPLQGKILQPLPITFGQYGYRSAFVAGRCSGHLRPHRRLEAMVRETVLEMRDCSDPRTPQGTSNPHRDQTRGLRPAFTLKPPVTSSSSRYYSHPTVRLITAVSALQR